MGPSDLHSSSVRRRWTPVLLATALALAVTVGGCDDEENGSGPDGAGIPALVVVSPTQVVHPFSLDTVRFTAEAFDVLGDPVADAEFTWTSSDPAVATVAAGLAATLRAGQVEIQARAGDAIGRAALSVSPGTALENECMRCHTAANAYRHVAWGFDAASCTLCHVMDQSPHTEKVNGHEPASGGFVLLGAHVAAACTACHTPGSGTVATDPANSDDCVACHLADYQRVHPEGWPTDCALCHSPEGWTGGGGNIDHEQASGGFRLLGVHATLSCSACHDPATFAPLWNPASDQDCITCHQADYEAVHPAGWPTDCTLCHTTSGWLGATFDHEQATGFALPSNHETLACTACHDADTFAPLFSPTSNTDCYACHQADYEAQHPAGWPTNCAQCHQTTGWAM